MRRYLAAAGTGFAILPTGYLYVVGGAPSRTNNTTICSSLTNFAVMILECADPRKAARILLLLCIQARQKHAYLQRSEGAVAVHHSSLPPVLQAPSSTITGHGGRFGGAVVAVVFVAGVHRMYLGGRYLSKVVRRTTVSTRIPVLEGVGHHVVAHRSRNPQPSGLNSSRDCCCCSCCLSNAQSVLRLML